MAEHFVKSGYQVFIVTGWRPNMEREELVNGVNVYRVGGGFIEKVRSSLRGHECTASFKEKQTVSQFPAKRGFSDMLKVLHDHTWKNIYWPDFACTWYFPALNMAKSLFAKHSFSHYITASIPFTAHLVGNKLKKVYRDKRWIVDISDPFCFESSHNNNNKIYAKLNIFIERSVFKNAQAISILTKLQKDKYTECYPESAGKMFLNPNILSLDVSQFKENSGTIFNGNPKVRLVFIGNLIPGVRTPELLLEIFSLLVNSKSAENIELHLFGNLDYCKEAFIAYSHLIGRSIFLHGSVPRSTALQAMKDADFLVNIGNNNPYQEPSKVIEYISTGKPIINIKSIKDDSSAALLEHYTAVFNVYRNSPGQLAETASKLAQYLLLPPSVDTNELKNWLKPYRIESIVNNYLTMLFGY